MICLVACHLTHDLGVMIGDTQICPLNKVAFKFGLSKGDRPDPTQPDLIGFGRVEEYSGWVSSLNVRLFLGSGRRQVL